jgi:predicted esterase
MMPACRTLERSERADAMTDRDGAAVPVVAVEKDAGLAPLPADPLFTNLSIAGYPEAVVSVANGATSRRPVLVVLHGSGDRPDWNCDAWRHITGAQAFVLCPRGLLVPAESTKDDLRYTHRGGAYLRAHLDAALEALALRFGPYVDVDRPVVTGFSLGATEMGQVALGDPARFPRVAQLEGGWGVWTAAAIGAFSAKGGRRVLFGCGSSWCMAPAKATAARLERGGVEARVVQANVGHSNDRPLQEAIMSELGWFLEGDARWVVTP